MEKTSMKKRRTMTIIVTILIMTVLSILTGVLNYHNSLAEDGPIITPKMITRLNSWDDVEELTLQHTTNSEDQYVKWLISELAKPPMKAELFGNTEFINYTIGGINESEVDICRLLDTMQSVVTQYNSCHNLNVEISYESLENGYIQINVRSDTAEYITHILSIE